MRTHGHGKEVFRKELKSGSYNRVALTDSWGYGVWIGCDCVHGKTEFGHMTRFFKSKTKAIQYAKKTKPITFHNKYVRDVLYNMGSSLGAAIRNSMDVNDPQREHYKTVIGPRFNECIEYLVVNGIGFEEGMELISRGVSNQVAWLTSGFLNQLRQDVLENSKKKAGVQ